MRRNGYDSYHGRSRVRTFLKVLIVLLLVVLAVAVGALLWLEPYIDYSANGIQINLPFFQQKEPAPATGAPVVVTTPEPTPTPEPEEDFRGILLPNSALYDGTAAQRVEAAGATAALFDMKADDGSLGYISGLALAIQAEASAADPALNAAIQLLNGGEVYTVARVSCFRDNLVPRSDMSLAIHTNAGNWRDSGDTRWLSPANESARQYVVGVCRELAALGFDEILLDNWAFPTDGELGWIKADANYPADGRTAALEVFLEEVRAGLAEFPEVKVSLVTTASAAAGGAVESGQTAALLERADRVLVRLGEGETLPRLNETPVVPVLEQAGQARDWRRAEIRSFRSEILALRPSARSSSSDTLSPSSRWPRWASYMTCPIWRRMSLNSPFRSNSCTFSLATSTIWPALFPAARAV